MSIKGALNKKHSSTPPPGFSEVGFVPSRKNATVNCTLVAHQYSWAAQLAGNATLCRSMRKRKENFKDAKNGKDEES